MTGKLTMKRIGLLAMLAVALPSAAGQKYITTNVTRTLVDERYFGHCMAAISTGPQTVGLDCGSTWVTFSCSGDFNTPRVGQQKFSAAQLSLVTGNKVFLVVTDEKKHNGYCYVERIDNLAN